MQGLLDLSAEVSLTLEKSLAYRPYHPEYVLLSRWVNSWKWNDDGRVKANSKIVILGFEDPHVLELGRSAPTPTNDTFTTTMQLLASITADGVGSDIPNPLSQSMGTNRGQKLCAELPSEIAEAGFDLDPKQLLMAETEVYVFISGPSCLRQSFVVDFDQMGYVRNAYDKCIMKLPSQSPCTVKGQGFVNEGSVLIEVDDILEGMLGSASGEQAGSLPKIDMWKNNVVQRSWTRRHVDLMCQGYPEPGFLTYRAHAGGCGVTP